LRSTLWPARNETKVILFLFFTAIPLSSVAKSWGEELSCGNAIIDLKINEAEEGIRIWDVSLSIRTKFKKTPSSVLNYEQVYFKYSCVKTDSGKDYFTYQAYCSGSGCSDLDSWGVVSSDGQLILVPYKENKQWMLSILSNN
jgi:hypothetical protein